jgi:hypothetical protein
MMGGAGKVRFRFTQENSKRRNGQTQLSPIFFFPLNFLSSSYAHTTVLVLCENISSTM